MIKKNENTGDAAKNADDKQEKTAAPKIQDLVSQYNGDGIFGDGKKVGEDPKEENQEKKAEVVEADIKMLEKMSKSEIKQKKKTMTPMN